MRKLIVFLGLVCFWGGSAWAQIPVTEKTRLTENWEFLRSDLGGIWEAGLNQYMDIL